MGKDAVSGSTREPVRTPWPWGELDRGTIVTGVVVLFAVGVILTTVLVVRLAALLLVGAELDALSWASRNEEDPDPLRRRRVAQVLQLGGLGLAAALVPYAVAAPWSTGSALVFVLATASLGGVGALAFRIRKV